MQHVKILQCDAFDCAFNQKGDCHALAITVGGGTDRRCDTFWKASNKGGAREATGEVGACKAISCQYNENLLCQAEGIRVGYEGDAVDCLTYKSR